MRVDSATDRRIIDVQLTEQGHALANRLSGINHKWIVAKWVSQLTADQRTAFRNSMCDLRAIIENTPENIPSD
jgi:DNA-binding MarR family transcriptional regulator